MLFANHREHGGTFLREFCSNDVPKNLKVATGYFGVSLLNQMRPLLIKVASGNGTCKILIGMVFYGGVTQKQKDALEKLDQELRKINSESGIYISVDEYHGKIYLFETDDAKSVYVGSSNFSNQGFEGRLECTLKVENQEDIDASSNYVNYLFGKDKTLRLDDVDLRVKKKKKVVTKPSKSLMDYEISCDEWPIEEPVGSFKLGIRADRQANSSLNLYFEQGRSVIKTLPDGTTKKAFAPRPWYEVELTSSADVIRNPFYPKSTAIIKKNGDVSRARKGEFWAYIKEDGKCFKIKMVVHADNGKNISSSKESGGRETLGRYLKGKLEDSGVLSIRERITSETLEEYGRDYVEFKKIDDDNYIIEF